VIASWERLEGLVLGRDLLEAFFGGREAGKDVFVTVGDEQRDLEILAALGDHPVLVGEDAVGEN